MIHFDDITFCWGNAFARTDEGTLMSTPVYSDGSFSTEEDDWYEVDFWNISNDEARIIRLLCC